MNKKEKRHCPDCSGLKWRTELAKNYIQCLRCYRKYSPRQFLKKTGAARRTGKTSKI